MRSLVAIALIAATPPLFAQRPTPIPPPDSTSRPTGTAPRRCDGLARPGCPAPQFIVGVAGAVAQPVGEFKGHVGVSGGADFYGLVMVAPNSPLALMVTGGFIQYGNEREDVAINNPFGGLIDGRMQTKYQYAYFGAGPEIGVRTGPVRPYVAGTVGYGHFGTRASLQAPSYNQQTGADEWTEIWGKSYQGDGVLQLQGLGGVRIRLASPVTLDVGARFVHNGEAEYVERGGIQQDDAGNTTVNITRSRADFVTYTLGASLAFGRSR